MPHGLVKGTPVFYHLDNVDWQEDTPDGKNTSHYLLLAAFQRKTKEISPVELSSLCQKQVSATLDENTFNDLLPYTKPPISQFQRSQATIDAHLPVNITDDEQNFVPWLCFRSYEQVLARNSKEGTSQASNEMKINSVSNLKLPSFAATNSLAMNIDTTLTNIFSTPLIPDPASSYSAIYTALIRAQNVSTWACGGSLKVVVSLHLDLYEKAYLLVNSNGELQSRFILCLGELHIVFTRDWSICQQLWVRLGMDTCQLVR